MRLLGPQSQDAARSPLSSFSQSGYRPIGSSTRLSGLSRSDFVLWPTDQSRSYNVSVAIRSIAVGSSVAFDPRQTSRRSSEQQKEAATVIQSLSFKLRM